MRSSPPDNRPAPSSATVVCENVTRRYGRESGGLFRGRGSESASDLVTALSDVSLTLKPGELTVVAGPSGSGKSTLLHLLAALDVPTEGRVSVAGTDTSSLSERGRTTLRRRYVGIVFQRFHLLPALSARSNVALPLVEEGLSKSVRHHRADEALSSVGLDHRLTHRPGELSGGEKQRVAIARAIVNDPTLLVADEPTGELDTETGERVVSLLEDVATDRAVVVATHDQTIIDRGDRVIRLRDGRVVDDGT